MGNVLILIGLQDSKKWSKEKLASRLEEGAEVVKSVYRLVAVVHSLLFADS